MDLTQRQREILMHVARGETYREIGAALGIAPGTVRNHLHDIYVHLGARGAAHAVALWLRRERPGEMAAPRQGQKCR